MSYPYRGPQSPRDESPYSNYPSNPLSPQRNPHRLSGPLMSANNEARASLTRRFTTNALPTLSPIGQQRRQAAGEIPVSTAYNSRVPPSERKIRHIEDLLEQQRRINDELNKVDDQTRREIEEGLRHERSVSQFIAQSEPTTPPEYQDTYSPPVRLNRYSTASLTSPPGINGRGNRSSMQLTSPTTFFGRSSLSSNGHPSQSVPGSRRHSDDEDESEDMQFFYDMPSQRTGTKPNRNSMPITAHDRKLHSADVSAPAGSLHFNGFLPNGDDKASRLSSKGTHYTSSPPDSKTFLQVQHTADGFPKLIRCDDNGELSGVTSATALELAAANAEQQVADRISANRHRISLPASMLSSNGNIAPLNSILASTSDSKSVASNRQSIEVKYVTDAKRPGLIASPHRNITNGILKPSASYSMNDVPTLKSINGAAVGAGVLLSPTATKNNNNADHQQLESNMNGAPSSAAPPVISQTRDHAYLLNQPISNGDLMGTAQSDLKGEAASFDPTQPQDEKQPLSPSVGNSSGFGQQAAFDSYAMHSLNNGFSNMNLANGFGAQGQWPNHLQQYGQGAYGAYGLYAQGPQTMTNTGRLNSAPQQQQRRHDPDLAFNNVTVQELKGQILTLCKDQHGCRFLQKKLEERNTQDVEIIFSEAKHDFTTLMIDPFGNYLCQKLLEFCTDEQRTVLVEKAMPDMKKIAINQHGTRALQKMIEYVTAPEQIQMIITGLQQHVVYLIQDLNGNHVIQKCLNHLTPADAQFIFDAVGEACMIVGTHRHGCCVIQRCIDHATGEQKSILIDKIIANTRPLAVSQFGNYVVQYILDLDEASFTDHLCRHLLGQVVDLSSQQCSSNVIEKCLRCAGVETRRLMIEELMQPQELKMLICNSYGNFVIQTAMDCADRDTKLVFYEAVRPLLPLVRNSTAGRRMASKIDDFDSGKVTSELQKPYSPTNNHRGNRNGMIGAPANWTVNRQINGGGYGGVQEIFAPTPQRNHAYNTLNGGPTSYIPNGYGAPPFPHGHQSPLGPSQIPYGHF